MRTLGVLLLGAGLLVSGWGCCHTCQHTAGVCDCDPPPVETLLIPPPNGHPSLGVYATAPAAAALPAPAVTGPGKLPRVEPIPVLPKAEPPVK